MNAPTNMPSSLGSWPPVRAQLRERGHAARGGKAGGARRTPNRQLPEKKGDNVVAGSVVR